MTLGATPEYLKRPTEKILYKAITSTKFKTMHPEKQNMSISYISDCGCQKATTFSFFCARLECMNRKDTW